MIPNTCLQDSVIGHHQQYLSEGQSLGMRSEVKRSINNAVQQLKDAVEQIEAENGKDMTVLKVQVQRTRQQLREERKAQHIAIEHRKHQQLAHVYVEFVQGVQSITQQNSETDHYSPFSNHDRHAASPNVNNITNTPRSVDVAHGVSFSVSTDCGQSDILRMPTNVPALTMKKEVGEVQAAQPSAIKQEK